MYAAGTIFLEVAPSFDGLQNSAKRAVREAFAGVGGDVAKEMAQVEKATSKAGKQAGERYASEFGDRLSKAIKKARGEFDALSTPSSKRGLAAYKDMAATFERLGKVDLSKASSWGGAVTDLRTLSQQSEEFLRSQKDVDAATRAVTRSIRQQADEMDRALQRATSRSGLDSQQEGVLATRAARERAAEEKRAADALAKRIREEEAAWQRLGVIQEKAARENAARDAKIEKDRQDAIQARGRLEDAAYREDAKRISDKEAAWQRLGAVQARALRENTDRDARAAADEAKKAQEAAKLRLQVAQRLKKFTDDQAAAERKAAEDGAKLRLQVAQRLKKLSDDQAAAERKAIEDGAKLQLQVAQRLKKFTDDRLDAQRKAAAEEERAAAKRSAEWQKLGVLQERAGRENVERDDKIRLDVDRKRVDATMRALRNEIKTMSAQLKFEPDVDVAKVQARILQVRAQLEALARMRVHPSIIVDVTSELIALRRLEHQLKEVDRAAGRTSRGMSKLSSVGGAANAVRLFSGALLGIVTLGPLLIPMLAGVASGILGIGAAAASVLAGIGVLVLAFSGIAGAVGAMNDLARAQRTAAAGGANQRAALADQQRQISDARSLADAQRDLARARRDSAQSLVDAAQRIREAERGLADAQGQVLSAQLRLNDARAQAVRDLEDMNNQLAMARLNERSAEFAVEEASVHLNVVLEDDQATQREKDVAQLQYEQAVQRLKEQRTETARLEVDTKRANDAGVEGSEQVLNAKQAIIDATAGVANAERSLAESREDFAAAQVQAAERVADAEENLRRTHEDIAIGAAQAAVATDALATETNKLDEAMRSLSPAGQAFATFLFGLKPLLDQLRFAAQEGFLPGLQSGMQLIVDTYGPGMVRFVEDVSRALGDAAQAAADMFATPWWQDFFGYIADIAPDVIRQVNDIGLDLLTFAAAVFKAFAPLGEVILASFGQMAEGWAEWAMGLEDSDGFRSFVEYVQQAWPKVSELLGNLFELLIKVVVALEPYADRLLDVFIALTDWMLRLDDDTFAQIVQGVALLITVLQVASGLVAGVSGILLLFGSQVGVVVTAIVAAVAALAAFAIESESFREAIETVWGAIQEAIDVVVSWVRDDAIPALQELWGNMTDGAKGVAEDDSWNVIKSVIDGIRTAMDLAGMVFSTVWDWISWGFENVLVPVFQFAWAIIEPILRLFGGMFDVAWQIISRVVNMISQLFTYVFAPIFEAWWNTKVKPILEAFSGFWEEHVAPKISAFLDWFAPAWNGILDMLRTPIRLGIEWVINKGLIGAFNWIAERVPGMSKIDEVTIPAALQPGGVAPGSRGNGAAKAYGAYAGGTSQVLPGYTPGRDVHRFYSPTAGVLDLSGGEGIARPEIVAAIGADRWNAANAAAKSGNTGRALGYLGGYAEGGILGTLGDAWDAIVRGAKNVWGSISQALADPGAFLRGVIKTAVGAIPGLNGFDGPMAEAVAGVATKPVDALTGWIRSLFGAGSEGGGAKPVPGAGVGYQAMTQMLGAMGLPGARVTSSVRPGAKVAGYGVQSFHALGRAIDIAGPNMMGIFNALDAAYGGRSQELLYTPAGARQILRGGRRGNTSGVTAANHYSHVHWAMADGGIVPTLYDTGGDVPPGLSIVANKTRKPEATVTNQFIEDVKSMSRTSGPVVDARGATFGADAGDIADELQRRRRDEMVLAGVYDENLGVF